MKVQVIRMSGNPIEHEQADAYKLDWQNGFDAICEKHGKFGDEVEKELTALEKELKDKYNDLTIVEWELPKTGKAWIEKLSEYGNIMVTTNMETGKVILVIHDAPWA
jgi:predicted metalloenzyme YecM